SFLNCLSEVRVFPGSPSCFETCAFEPPATSIEVFPRSGRKKDFHARSIAAQLLPATSPLSLPDPPHGARHPGGGRARNRDQLIGHARPSRQCSITAKGPDRGHWGDPSGRDLSDHQQRLRTVLRPG